MPVSTMQVVGVGSKDVHDIRSEKEYILEFNIAMNDMESVNVVYSLHEL